MGRRGPYPSPVTTKIQPIKDLLNHIDALEMSQAEVFEKAGYSGQHAYRIRKGFDMKVQTLCDLAQVAGLKVVLVEIDS